MSTATAKKHKTKNRKKATSLLSSEKTLELLRGTDAAAANYNGSLNPTQSSSSGQLDMKKLHSPKADRWEQKNIKKLAKKDANEKQDEEERNLELLLFGGSAVDVSTAAEAEVGSGERVPYESEGSNEPVLGIGVNEENWPLMIEDRAGDRATLEGEADINNSSDDDEIPHDPKSTRHSSTASSDIADIGSETLGRGAWFDEDDNNFSVNLKASNRLRKVRNSESDILVSGTEYATRLAKRFRDTSTAVVSWSALESDLTTPTIHRENYVGSGMDEIERAMTSRAASLLQNADSLALNFTASRTLPPNKIEITRCTDANAMEYSNAAVQVVQFHPNPAIYRNGEDILLTAGFDKTLRFFAIDGETNKKLHGIYFPDMPIFSAAFMGDTQRVLCCGRRPFFYVYNAAAGKVEKVPRTHGRKERSYERSAVSPDGRYIAFVGNDGFLIVVCGRTLQWIADLKMNGSCRALAFSSSQEGLLMSSGSEGVIYIWDVGSRKCISKLTNEDGTTTSALALSESHMAVGAQSGVVNIYRTASGSCDAHSADMYEKQPLKSIMNVRTSADNVKFNHDGQMLALSTRRTVNEMKLFHISSSTVFSNWPTSKTPLGYVWSMDFSGDGSLLTIGNDKGKCLLYRLKHYAQ